MHSFEFADRGSCPTCPLNANASVARDARPYHWVLMVFTLAFTSAFGFEKIAFVDGYDFGHIFDCECREGTQKILDKVLETGADTILWRTHSGAIPRYVSAYEDCDRLEMPFDRRRMPDALAMQNWMRLWSLEPDPLRVVFEECAKRPQIKSRGVHMLAEDAHWQFSFLGNWNLEHPQYFCRDSKGRVQMYHQSFAYPEVVKHRVDVAREILDRGVQTLYLDIFRNGGWTVQIEYVEPNLAEWKRLYPNEPVPVPGKSSMEAWGRWTRVARRGFIDYLRELCRLTREKGARFIVNHDNLTDEDPGWMFRSRGSDWRELVRDDLVDGLAVTGIEVDEKDPFGSLERRFGRVAKGVKAAGKSVYFPILAYNFSKNRPSFGQVAQWAKMPADACVAKMLEIAARCGADGIVMECVDDGNYSPAVCKVIRGFQPEKGIARANEGRVAPVAETLDRYVSSGRIAGVVSVLSDADYNEQYDCAGWADVENGRKMTPDTVFAVFSMTKTFLGAAMMCAIDEGKLSLDDEVSKYLPEFADVKMLDGSKPRRALTLRDMTSHVNGFRGGTELVNRDIPMREVARRLAATPLHTQPGEKFSYGTATIDAAGACLEVAVGKSFEVYLKEKILDPLGMKDTTFTPNDEQVRRLVKAYTSDDKTLRPAKDGCTPQLVFPKKRPLCAAPGGGLFSTPRDMVRFSQMLAHHGEWKGKRLISRRTFDTIFAVKQTPSSVTKPYTCGSWLYGDWFGHEGAMRTDQRANLKTGQSRVFFIQTENRAGSAFFELKKEWHKACDKVQGTPPTVFGD